MKVFVYHKDLRPLDYPWTATNQSILLTKSGEYSIKLASGQLLADATVLYDAGLELPLTTLLEQESDVKLEYRVPVVAIGSNASPLVTKSKFSQYGSRGINQTTPMLPATIKNIGVGYSAHFVGGGYIPAAPFHDDGAEIQVVVSYLTKEQLRAIDNTEPTYRRLNILKEKYPVTLENGQVLETAYIYASRYGVLHDSTAKPISLTTQSNLFKILNDEGVGYGFFDGTAETVSDRIAGKKKWVQNKIQAYEVLDEITLEDGISGKEECPARSQRYRSWNNALIPATSASHYKRDIHYSRDDSEWENSLNPDFDPWWIDRDNYGALDEEVGHYDFADLNDEELFDSFAEQGLDEEWLSQKDFDSQYDNWWNERTNDGKVHRF